nr:hypothetical protein [Tanacetum cinerariifolium]
ICGCKARVVFDMVPNTTKYTLSTFDVEHNHELDRVEYKHLSKAERKLSDAEQLLLSKMRMQTLVLLELIICMSGQNGLPHWQQYIKDFSFDYFVKDVELCGLFWVDEVAKRNYKEFGDIVSFDAAYKTNKYKMAFVPSTAIDNHRRFVTVGFELLKKETVEAYGWLLRAFRKAFVRAHNIVVKSVAKKKYIVCNREGCLKDVCLNTLDRKKNDRHVMSSNFRICGCKARVGFDMVPNTTKYTLSTFDVEHNHELDRVEYKHLSKAERKLSDAKQLLLSKMRMQTLVLLELIIFAKCNYKEFGDIVSFDATYKTNKYKMAFVPSTAIDNHKRFVTVGSELLKKETVEAYGWLLRAFRKAFVRARNIVVKSVAKKEVLGFFDVTSSGNPTPYYDSIVSTTSPTLTSFGNSEFLLEEVDAFLDIEDDPTSLEVD